MAFNVMELRAINFFCKENNLRPSLSAGRSKLYFTHKATGLEKTASLAFVIDSYKAEQKREARERARQKRLEANK